MTATAVDPSLLVSAVDLGLKPSALFACHLHQWTRADRPPGSPTSVKLLAAFETNETTTIDTLLADDVVSSAPSQGMNSGRRNGKQELVRGDGRLIGGTLRSEIHDVLASDDHVVVLQTNRDGHGSPEDRFAAPALATRSPR
jgi:hypothetical protein